MNGATMERRSIVWRAPERPRRTAWLLLAALLLAATLTACKKDSPAPPPAPAAPGGVTAQAGDALVTLSWNDVSGASSYNLYWGTATGVGKAAGTRIGAAVSPFAHTGRTNGTPYYYVVTAVNAGGESAESAEVTATPAGAPIRAACADDTSAYAAGSAGYSTTTVLNPAPVTATATSVPTVTVNIPANAVSVGIVALGSNTGYKFIEHGLLLTTPQCITTPVGTAPLSFNQVDVNGDGAYDDSPGSLVNNEAVALAFPNNGTNLVLPAGDYTFPVGAVNAALSGLEGDTLTPIVYYKTATATKPTLKINVFVADGVRAGLSTDGAAAADAEMLGAAGVLRAMYETDADSALTLQFTYAIVPASYVTIDSDTEFQALLSGYPSPLAHDAINLFVIGTIGPQVAPAGVLGFAAGIPGPFSRQGTVVSGVIAEYQGDADGRILGFILAHELGHFLGLYHTSQTNETQNGIEGVDPIADTPECVTAQAAAKGGVANCPDISNLMFPIAPASSSYPTPEFSTGQGTVVRLNPAVGMP